VKQTYHTRVPVDPGTGIDMRDYPRARSEWATYSGKGARICNREQNPRYETRYELGLCPDGKIRAISREVLADGYEDPGTGPVRVEHTGKSRKEFRVAEKIASPVYRQRTLPATFRALKLIRK